MAITSTSTLRSHLKKTLNKSMSADPTRMANLVLNKYLHVESMDDAYVDDIEVASTALASEKPEGSMVSIGSMREGQTFRYQSRTYATGLIVTEEAIEDNKYKEAVDQAMSNMTALMETADTDAGLLLGRGFNTAYTYGTGGKPLWSASHPLPMGGTFSNIFATSLPPSVAAVSQARVQARKMPSLNGTFTNIELSKVVHPVDQETEWEVVLGSKLETDMANNFSRINVAQKMGLKAVPVVYWSNTTTSYCFMTTAKGGPTWKWRRKPQSRTMDGIDNLTIKHIVSARWSRGTSNPRGTIGVQ